VVLWALNVVLLTSIFAREIKAARVADPMGVGIVLMLLERTIVGERSATAVAIRHDGGGQKKRVSYLTQFWC